MKGVYSEYLPVNGLISIFGNFALDVFQSEAGVDFCLIASLIIVKI